MGDGQVCWEWSQRKILKFHPQPQCGRGLGHNRQPGHVRGGWQKQQPGHGGGGGGELMLLMLLEIANEKDTNFNFQNSL